jgi:hypothetical protein
LTEAYPEGEVEGTIKVTLDHHDGDTDTHDGMDHDGMDM